MAEKEKQVADQAATMTAEEAVKLFAKQGITVTVVKTDKKGPLRDAETKRFVTETVPLAAAHIVGVNIRDGEVGITTVDGQKFTAATK